MIPTIKVLDISIFDGTIEDATNILIDQVNHGSKNNYCISAPGAHGLVHAKKDSSFKNVLQSFFINLPDGMPGVWIGKLKGAKKIERCYGPDFFENVLKSTADRNIRHYFCGGKENVPEALKEACASKFKNNKIFGTYSPPFRELTNEEMTALAKNINEKEIDVVWVGISTPKQEQFAKWLCQFVNVHFIITVGAAFDFHIGMVKQAPKYMQKSGLEWLFRLCVEPKRLWKRYVSIVPLFIYYNLVNFFNLRKKNI